jgi:nucleoside-triphosphatase
LNLYIFSNPIKSGKTTLLQTVFSNKNACGILMPDINGCRFVQDIGTQQKLRIQKITQTKATDIIIGNYVFDAAIFTIANDWIGQLHLCPQQNIVIDEIGKLELNNLGLEPSFSIFLNKIKNTNKNVILVVRDYLLDEVMQHYKLLNAIILDKTAITNTFLSA